MSLISNIIFSIKKPKIIFLSGVSHKEIKGIVSRVLEEKFKIGQEVLIFEEDFKNKEEIEFLVKKSSQTIILVNNINETIIDKSHISGQELLTEEKDKEIEKIREIIKILPDKSFLVLNFDDDMVKKMKNEKEENVLTFGFQERADFQATDINLDEGTNFKISYMGNIVPFWLQKPCDRTCIYTALATVAIGTIFGLNLVEISQSIKDYKI